MYIVIYQIYDSKRYKKNNKINKSTCILEVVYSKTKTVNGTCNIKLKVVKVDWKW